MKVREVIAQPSRSLSQKTTIRCAVDHPHSPLVVMLLTDQGKFYMWKDVWERQPLDRQNPDAFESVIEYELKVKRGKRLRHATRIVPA